MRTSIRPNFRNGKILASHRENFRAGLRERNTERFMKFYIVQEVEEANAQPLRSSTVDDLLLRYVV